METYSYFPNLKTKTLEQLEAAHQKLVKMYQQRDGLEDYIHNFYPDLWEIEQEIADRWEPK